MKLVVKENTLLTYEFKGRIKEIKFSDLSKYWQFANEDDFEVGTAKEINDYIIGSITTASGQSGIVYVWDKKKYKLVHISEDSFAISTSLTNEYVYTLLCVSTYGKKAEFKIAKTLFGIMDVNCEGVVVADNIDIIEWDGDINDINLNVIDSNIIIKYCDRLIKI